ncbi:MAG: hypothetical protein MHMPM18_002087 [Marteilia pararefringens]
MFGKREFRNCFRPDPLIDLNEEKPKDYEDEKEDIGDERQQAIDWVAVNRVRSGTELRVAKRLDDLMDCFSNCMRRDTNALFNECRGLIESEINADDFRAVKAEQREDAALCLYLRELDCGHIAAKKKSYHDFY